MKENNFDSAYKLWSIKELQYNIKAKKFYLECDIHNYGEDRHKWQDKIDEIKRAIEWHINKL